MAYEISHAILELLRTSVGTACLLILALVGIGFGVWIIASGRLPSWVKGPFRWPLGDAVTPRIAVVVGWASAIAGLASLSLRQRFARHRANLGLDLTVGASVLAVASLCSHGLEHRPVS